MCIVTLFTTYILQTSFAAVSSRSDAAIHSNDNFLEPSMEACSRARKITLHLIFKFETTQPPWHSQPHILKEYQLSIVKLTKELQM